jgi:hypothetical protein
MAFLARALTQQIVQATNAPSVSSAMPTATKLRDNLAADKEARVTFAEKLDLFQAQPAAFGTLMLGTPLVPLVMRRHVRSTHGRGHGRRGRSKPAPLMAVAAVGADKKQPLSPSWLQPVAPRGHQVNKLARGTDLFQGAQDAATIANDLKVPLADCKSVRVHVPSTRERWLRRRTGGHECRSGRSRARRGTRGTA